MPNEIAAWLSATCETWHQSFNGFLEYGTDFCISPDTPVYAVDSGTVLGQGSYGGGGVISVAAATGIADYYQHLDCMYVHKNDSVTAGELIGTSGGQRSGDPYPAPKCGLYSSSKYSGGPHIEFGINAPYNGMWNPHGWTPNVDPVPQKQPCGLPGHCLKNLEQGNTGGGSIPGQWRKLLFRSGQIGFGLNADNREQVFAVARAGVLDTHYQTVPSGSWNNGFVSLGGTWRTGPAQQVATGVNADGREQLYMVGQDHKLYTSYQTAVNGGFSGWVSVGGGLPDYAVPTVGYNADGRQQVFVVGPNHVLYTTYQTVVNGGFSSWVSLGGSWSFSDIPAVDVNADGREQLYLVGDDHQLYTSYQTVVNGGFSAWVSLGGSWHGNPGVGLNADGRQQVYLVGDDGVLYTKWQVANNAGFVANWEAHPGVTFRTSDVPAVGVNSDGRQEIYLVATNGRLYTIYQTAVNTGWSQTWTDFGGTWSGNATIGMNADGRQQLFLIGNDGQLYTRFQTATNSVWYSSWVSHGGSF